VALTAHAMAGDRERYLEAGMDGYLAKPIDPSTLFAAVELRQPVGDRRHADSLPGTAPIGVEEMWRRLGSHELVAEVSEMFLVDCPARLAQIRAAVAARDPDAIRIPAHALKGAAGDLSATRVAECAGALELMAADGAFDPITADALFARLEAESTRLLAVLQAGLVAPARNGEP
jgi:two-component system sensor histidine kinase/response regulator